MSLRAAAKDAAKRLGAAGIPDADFEAELLARKAAGVSRSHFFAGAAASRGELARLHELIERRLEREPAAYITGSREFYGRQFAVGPGVLIPRPETELLVEVALAEITRSPGVVVADAGTGSGAIAVSIAAEAPATRVVGIDVSADALAIAARNVAAHAPGTQLVRGDLLAPLDSAGIVLANLPYIPTWEIDALEPEVSRWEPRVALDGGADGFALIRRLIDDCDRRIRPRLLALEVGYGQADAAVAELRARGRETRVVKDLAGIDRVVCARWE
ncbi:MAG: peptide chain release factor N(5)-glutamine methyltransferase [Thermoflexaceae bacterium]|nr:peptide chain release factor N(5)-glutamine methyltransferase [Thermoflexaceae bacterium]